MEPVEIDIRMKQNVTEEGKKATGAMGEMDEAAKKMQEQVESMLEQRKKLIADIEKNLSKTATNISNTSDTLSGDVSKLKKASDILGESLESAKKEVSDVEAVLQSGTATIEDFSSASEQLNQVGGELADILTKSNDLQDISNDLMKAAGINSRQAATAKKLWAAATEVLSSKLGISLGLSKALAATGIGAIIAAVMVLINLYNKWKEKQEEINRLKKEFTDIEISAVKAMAEEKTKVEQLHKIANDHNKSLEIRNKAIKQLNSLMPDYNGFIDAEGKLIDNADTAVKNYIVSLYKLEKAKKLLSGIEDDNAKIDELKTTGSGQVTEWERFQIGFSRLLKPFNKNEEEGRILNSKTEKWLKQITDAETGKKQKEDAFNELLKDNSIFDALFGGGKKGGGSGGGSNRTPAAIKEEYDAQAALAEQLLEIRKRTAALTVDIMQDGLEKRLQQIDLEESEELARIKEHQQKILDEYNKSDAGKKNPQADIKSIPGIDPETLAGIEAEKTKITNAAEEKRKQATEANAREITDLARKYASEEVNIRYDYQQDIDKLEKAGNTEAANAARMERDKRISELTAEMFESTDIYKTATNEKIQASKEATEQLVSDIKKRIEALVIENKLTRADADRMIGDLNKTQVSRENSKNENNPFAKLIKGLNDYKKAKKELDDKRKSVTPGELVKLEDAANKTLATTAEAAAVSLAGVQEILGTVVGALDQLGLLTEEEKQTANEVIGMVGGAADIAMGIATGNPVQIITGAVNLLANAISLFDKKSKDIAKKQKEHKKNLDDLAHAYTNLQREVDKALGTDVYKKQKEAIANLRKQIAENERLIALEQQKKKKKQNQEDIAAWRAEIDALKGEIDDTIRSITEDLAQTNARDLARTLADALVSAARTGEDAFTAMGDVINDVLRNAVVNALSKKFLEKKMDEATEYLAGAMGDGDLSDYEKRRFEEMIRNAGTAFNTALSAYDELFANQDDAARRSASKGIAQASQDSIDELSGTITFMAGEFRTANVLAAARTETGRDMLIITRTILSVLNVIAENTSYNKRLEDIAEGIEKLNRDGVNVKR